MVTFCKTYRIRWIVFFILLIAKVIILGCVMTEDSAKSNHTRVEISGNQWIINSDPVNKGSKAEGLLMNVRMVNAVFQDIGTQAIELPTDYNAEENTDRFVEMMPSYILSGINAFTISLQGGFPGYEGAVNSGFRRDGSLDEEYMDRVKRVINEADYNGSVVILSCFYQRQHSHKHALAGKNEIFNAVSNVAQWIMTNGFTNVVLEISNEYAHSGFANWNEGAWLRSVSGQVELIQHAQSVAPDLPVSTSGMGNGTIAEPIANASDFILIHFNNTPIDLIPERVAEAIKYGKPVLCNEDDKIGPKGANAARLSVMHGAGWGFMHSAKNQRVPFEFDGADDDPVVYGEIARLTSSK